MEEKTSEYEKIFKEKEAERKPVQKFRIVLIDTRTVFVVNSYEDTDEDKGWISFKKEDILFGNFATVKDEIAFKSFKEVLIPKSSILFIAEVD